MKIIGIHEAKIHFYRLVREMESGLKIIISRVGKLLARFMPIRSVEKPRQPGLLRGRIHISDDFDAPLPPDLMERLRGEPKKR